MESISEVYEQPTLRFGTWMDISKIFPPIPNQQGDRYLITTDDGQIMSAKYMRINREGKNMIKWVCPGKGCSRVIKAWMPYPEPF